MIELTLYDHKLFREDNKIGSFIIPINPKDNYNYTQKYDVQYKAKKCGTLRVGLNYPIKNEALNNDSDSYIEPKKKKMKFTI